MHWNMSSLNKICFCCWAPTTLLASIWIFSILIFCNEFWFYGTAPGYNIIFTLQTPRLSLASLAYLASLTYGTVCVSVFCVLYHTSQALANTGLCIVNRVNLAYCEKEKTLKLLPLLLQFRYPVTAPPASFPFQVYIFDFIKQQKLRCEASL